MAHFWVNRYENIFLTATPDNLFDQLPGYHTLSIIRNDNSVMIGYYFLQIFEYLLQDFAINSAPVFPVISHYLLIMSDNACFYGCRSCIRDNALTGNGFCLKQFS